MSGPVLLLRHSLRRTRTLVLTMGILLGAFQIVLVAAAGAIQASGGFETLSALLPPFVRELMGPAFVSFMSFAGIVCVGYFHVVVMAALVGLIVALALIPVSEIESGFVDLILSRPIARHWIVTRTIVTVVLAIIVVLALMMAGTWGGLELLARREVAWPSAKLILSLAINLGALLLCWSGVAMAIGSASRRRSVAAAISGLLALVMFLLDYVGRLWHPAESIAWLSPFRYYTPFDLVMGHALPWKNLVVPAGIALAGFVAAYVLFARRDIAR